MTQLPNDLTNTFGDLCNPFCYSLSSIPSEEGWDYISQLSKLHGVTAFLFYRTRSLGIPLPKRIKKEWLGYYLNNLAQEQRARRQIKELKEILDPEGIPMILLKGASAMMRLYPELGLRTFVDLDILIPVDKAPRFKKEIVKAAYKPLGTMYSPEFEEIEKFDNHLDPYTKEDSLMVEPHVSILGGMGDYPAALSEIWLGKESTSTGAGFLVDNPRRQEPSAYFSWRLTRYASRNQKRSEGIERRPPVWITKSTKQTRSIEQTR